MSTTAGRTGQIFYVVKFEIQRGSGFEPSSIEMLCTVQELQDLLAKLKDAKKNMEKFAEAKM